MKYFLLIALLFAPVPAVSRERDVEANARYGLAVIDYSDGSTRRIYLRLEPVECAMRVEIDCPSDGPCMARDLPMNVPMCQTKRRAARH